MNTTLFFLRSSEHKIAANIFPITGLEYKSVYTEYFGFKNTDIGIYSLTNNQLSGAAWIRLYRDSDGVYGYVNDTTPVLIIGVIHNMVGLGIGSLMMGQLLQEAAVVYDQISVSVTSSSREVDFYTRLGFIPLSEAEHNDRLIMVKKLDKKEIVRPSDGYDPRRWMD